MATAMIYPEPEKGGRDRKQKDGGLLKELERGQGERNDLTSSDDATKLSPYGTALEQQGMTKSPSCHWTAAHDRLTAAAKAITDAELEHLRMPDCPPARSAPCEGSPRTAARRQAT
jgi:hypothetical protein